MTDDARSSPVGGNAATAGNRTGSRAEPGATFPADRNGFGELRLPFWDDAATVAMHPDYQRVLDVVVAGLASTAVVPASDLAARVAATGARLTDGLDQAGWASFAILSLGQEMLLGLLDGSRETLSDEDMETLEDLRAYQEAAIRRDREERGWP